MRRLPFLLRPGWVALAVVVVAFTYLCFTVLAPWQLGKNTRTSRENQQIEYSLSTAPVPLKTILPQQDSSAPNEQWRRVTATGHYLPDVQVLARLRVVDPFRDRSVVADGVVVPLACHVRVGGAQLPDDRSQPPVEGAPRCFAARSD